MAVEFGAKLYLKDNMYATLKKNLGLQREFSEQVDKTNASMQQMGRTRVNATINATDMNIIEFDAPKVDDWNNILPGTDVDVTEQN